MYLCSNPFADVVYVEPPGHSKRVCFVILEVLSKGITIVVEPLKATISTQVSKLKEQVVVIEQLYSLEDAETQAKSTKKVVPHAAERLLMIVDILGSSGRPKDVPDLLFLTPELFINHCVFNLIVQLAEHNALERVVCD